MIGAQMGTPAPLSAAERQKAEAERSAKGPVPNYPQLVDMTHPTGIHVDLLSIQEERFIAESISGEAALIDHAGDGWPNILQMRGVWI
jgi:hypothetical protein